MIKVYTGFKGFAVSLFFVAGGILLVCLFFWGIAKAIQLLFPLLMVLSYLLVAVFSLGFIPASYFKDLRPGLSVYAMLMSQLLGVMTWMVSFFFVVNAFGMGAVFLCLLFQFLAPIAIAVALLKGAWSIAAHLSIWTAMTYAMRYFSRWVLKLDVPQQERSRIIDVEAQVKG